jgi:uncharacterized protein YyaL (SSP411 family)
VPIVGAVRHQEKREGAFYVWSAGQVGRLIGDDGPVVSRRFGIEPNGNAPADPQGEFTGQNILYVAQEIDDIAVRAGRSAEEVVDVLARARRVLFEARKRRSRRISTTRSSQRGTVDDRRSRGRAALVDSPHH